MGDGKPGQMSLGTVWQGWTCCVPSLFLTTIVYINVATANVKILKRFPDLSFNFFAVYKVRLVLLQVFLFKLA